MDQLPPQQDHTQAKRATAPLWFGGLSCVLWLLPIVGLPMAIVGLVLSIKSLRQSHTGAKIAVILSIIGLLLSIGNAVLGAFLAVQKI